MHPSLTVVKHLWVTDMMNDGQPVIDAVSAFLTQSWLDGELPFQLVDDWIDKINTCPEMNKWHGEDGRAWCAYCGYIDTAWCQGCERWFSRKHHPEDYERILWTRDAADGFCIRCWDAVSAWEPKHGYQAASEVRKAERRFHIQYRPWLLGSYCMTCKGNTPEVMYFDGYMECFQCARATASGLK